MVELYNPHFQRDGLHFAPVKDSDREQLYHFFYDDQIAFHFAAPRTSNHRVRKIELMAGVEEWISLRRQDFTDDHSLCLTINRQDDLVGLAMLSIEESNYRSGKIIVAVRSDQRGQGIASSTINLMSTWAISELGLASVKLNSRSYHAAIRHLAEQQGFVEEEENVFLLHSPANRLLPDNRSAKVV